ncbi:hypothetical protein ACF1G0_22335 [Streptomyces sp. NPDC013953]
MNSRRLQMLDFGSRSQPAGRDTVFIGTANGTDIEHGPVIGLNLPLSFD